MKKPHTGTCKQAPVTILIYTIKRSWWPASQRMSNIIIIIQVSNKTRTTSKIETILSLSSCIFPKMNSNNQFLTITPSCRYLLTIMQLSWLYRLSLYMYTIRQSRKKCLVKTHRVAFLHNCNQYLLNSYFRWIRISVNLFMPYFLLKDLHVQNINISTVNTFPEVRLIVGIISRAFLLLTRSTESL